MVSGDRSLFSYLEAPCLLQCNYSARRRNWRTTWLAFKSFRGHRGWMRRSSVCGQSIRTIIPVSHSLVLVPRRCLLEIVLQLCCRMSLRIGQLMISRAKDVLHSEFSAYEWLIVLSLMRWCLSLPWLLTLLFKTRRLWPRIPSLANTLACLIDVTKRFGVAYAINLHHLPRRRLGSIMRRSLFLKTWFGASIFSAVKHRRALHRRPSISWMPCHRYLYGDAMDSIGCPLT